MQDLWPNQREAIRKLVDAIESGETRVLFSSPTGSGKTRVFFELAKLFSYEGFCCIYTNRKMLVEQMCKLLQKEGVDFGVRAAGYKESLDSKIQICSVQTEKLRVIKEKKRNVHGAFNRCLVIIDEAHVNKGSTVRELIKIHEGYGHQVIGATATPCDLGGIYKRLIVCGKVSELQKSGILTRAIHYGSPEPVEVKRLSKKPIIRDSEIRGYYTVKRMHGCVFDWIKRLNPELKPTILFAPGVRESVWFCEELNKNGIRSAHIDGKHIVIDNKTYQSERGLREEILEMSSTGEVKVICNRFVMREGVDAPWLSHGIFATTFGSVQTYIQAGGRLLRSYPGKEFVTIQDHGGNWWRYGSLNKDIDWKLGITSEGIYFSRIKELSVNKELMPTVCPYCGAVKLGNICFECKKKDNGRLTRKVVMVNGDMEDLNEPIFKTKIPKSKIDTTTIWKSCYYAARNSKRPMTFNQTYAWFFRKHKFYPPRNLPLMPIKKADWYRLVKDVHYSELYK